MQILVTSPIPTHPQNHGNRARVHAFLSALQARGHAVHFVYSGFEGLSREQEQAIRAAWDHVYILPYKRAKRHQSRRSHHLIDDWYDERLTALVHNILATWSIDAVIANYVWYSKYLDTLARPLPRYIDTHDIFAERHTKLKADGITPQWFSTTKREESKGLNRADTLFAIQDIEARELATRTTANVDILGHLLEPAFLPLKARKSGRLQVGFIASTNMVNIRTMELIDAALTAHPHLFEVADFCLAGAIAHHPAAKHSGYRRLGFVDDIGQFYRDMDVILNPNIGGSGLKIKSIEALAHGKPLIATRDAMIGIESDEPLHQLPGVEDVCLALADLAINPDMLDRLAEKSRAVFTAYQAHQHKVLDRYFPPVHAKNEIYGKPAEGGHG